MGANLTKMDDWTLSLLTNPEVIAVNQQSKQGRAVMNDSKKAIWVAKPEAGAGAYVAIFNLSDTQQTVQYPLQSLGLTGVSYRVRDLWEHRNLGNEDRLSVNLPAHVSVLYRVGGN
jgi:streptogramin lyase